MRTVFVSTGTLFTVAARELGDATQWWRIAAMNGLRDPWVSGVLELRIPDHEPRLTGGLPPRPTA